MTRSSLLLRTALRVMLAFGLGCAFGGCGAKPDTSGSCSADPLGCPAGKTCWPTDKAGAFSCLASKPSAAVGSDCELLVGHTGCADGLICLTSAPDPDAGTVRSYCTRYCDPAHPMSPMSPMSPDRGCSGTDLCQSVLLFGSVPIYACIEQGPPPVRDAAVGN